MVSNKNPAIVINGNSQMGRKYSKSPVWLIIGMSKIMNTIGENIVAIDTESSTTIVVK